MARFSLALVTGASSGIGERFARELAAAGTDLVLVARRADLLTALAEELAARYGVRADVLGADLTDPAGRGPVEDRLRATADPVDLLVNNAGTGSTGEFAALPLEGELAQVDLNVVALVRLTHAALPGMVERGHGGVLNVASAAALTPTPGSATYGATKAYVRAFSEALHGEVKRHGVTVSVLLPGQVRSPYADPAGAAGNGRADGRHEPGWAPGFTWQRPDEVVRAGLAAVAAGRAVCIPGATNKAVAAALRLTPRSFIRGLAGRNPGSQAV